MDSIPRFMRRPVERAPAKPAIETRAELAARPARQALPRLESVIHGGVPPVQPDFGIPADLEALPEAPSAAPVVPDVPIIPAVVPAARAAARLPWLARRAAPAAKAAAVPGGPSDIVDLTARRGTADLAPDPERIDLGEAVEDEDVAFQVTLPRSVIRQIRMLAAEEGTTHRATVLRALRGAGLQVPEGADIDRRGPAARRRQQA